MVNGVVFIQRFLLFYSTLLSHSRLVIMLALFCNSQVPGHSYCCSYRGLQSAFSLSCSYICLKLSAGSETRCYVFREESSQISHRAGSPSLNTTAFTLKSHFPDARVAAARSPGRENGARDTPQATFLNFADTKLRTLLSNFWKMTYQKQNSFQLAKQAVFRLEEILLSDRPVAVATSGPPAVSCLCGDSATSSQRGCLCDK